MAIEAAKRRKANTKEWERRRREFLKPPLELPPANIINYMLDR